MEVERLFSMAGYLAMFGWIVLAAHPLHPFKRQAHIAAGIIVPVLLSIGYLILIATQLKGAEGGFGSLHDVATLFSKPELLLAGWIHYLAFDLFIGAWELRDSQRHQIPHLVMIPCLLMTFMLGPIGLLFYFAIRTAKLKSLSLDNAPVSPERSVGGPVAPERSVGG